MKFSEKLEAWRVTHGLYASNHGDDHGAFVLPGPHGEKLRIIASSGDTDIPWEHVSVSTGTRTPNWTEMCFVKDLFWSEDEVVMQLHPAKADYINQHTYCLHLWRPKLEAIPLPPKECV